MAIRKLPPEDWGPYFDALSGGLAQGQRVDTASIRVFSPELGNQPETRWLPLHGITYDPRSDVLEVEVEGLGHRVHDPAAIFVDEDERGALLRLEVVREDGTHEIVELT